MSAQASSTLVVLLSGRKGVGKDTAADLLVRHHGFMKVAFADALRLMALDVVRTFMGYEHASMSWFTHRGAKEVPMWDINEYQLANPQWADDPDTRIPVVHPSRRTPRQVMQVLGTDIVRRHVGANVWVDATIQRIQKAQAASAATRVVISDCRFPIEHARVRDAFPDARVIVLRLEGEHARAPRNNTGRHEHVSETAMDGYESFYAVVHNDKRKGPETLLLQLEQVMGLSGSST